MKISEKFIAASEKLCSFDEHINAPYLRKSFQVDFVPKRAEITICGLGFYELYINGTDITKGFLAPYISNTDDICYYDNYDVSKYLKKGENVIGITLGNGFRNPFGGFVWDFDKSEHIGPVTVAMYFEAYSDGKSIIFEADESFKTFPSPITFDEYRMGCYYDARLEVKDWNMPNFDDSSWKNAKIIVAPKGEKRLSYAEPIRVRKIVKPIKVDFFDELPFAYESTLPDAKPVKSTVRKNVYVFDFGKNSAGITKLKINGKKGQKITIRHGEMLQNGRFTINNIIFDREGFVDKYYDYFQKDVFICKGGYEEFIPKFKYDGFRYAYVEGLNAEQASLETLEYVVFNSDVKPRAAFKCSNNVINRLYDMTRESDLSNLFYFPNDCPQREKNGWTCDASMSSEHMLLNLTVEKSLCQWLDNIQKAQNEEGALPGIIPTGGWGFEWGNGPAWDSVCVYLPYFIYKYTGDKNVIVSNSDMISKYLKYVYSKRNEDDLIEFGLGDWVDPFEEENGRITAPLIVTDSIMVYDIANKARYLYECIGDTKNAELAGEIANSIKKAVRINLIDSNLTVLGNCQTSQSLAVETGIFSDDEIETARRRLIEIVERDGIINTCGVIGARFIFHALIGAGRGDLAYKIITGKSRTCYGYWVDNGETTLSENWRSKDHKHIDSKNHHFLGDISSVFVQYFAGLRPNPKVCDISYFEIRPVFLEELNFAEASYESRFGTVRVRWEREDEKIRLSVNIPPGTHGKIIAGNEIYEWEKSKNEYNKTVVFNTGR